MWWLYFSIQRTEKYSIATCHHINKFYQKLMNDIIILKSSSIKVLLIVEVVQICQTLSFSNQDNCLEPSLSFPAKGWISSNLAFPWLGDKVTIERSLQKFVCRANLRPELPKIFLFEKPSEKFVCRIIFRSKYLHQLMMRLIDWHLRILKFNAADSEVILQKSEVLVLLRFV